MTDDDLHRPLGADRDDDPRVRRPTPWTAVAWGGVALAFAGVGAFAWLGDPGAGGEPFAVARIETAPPSPPKPTATAVPPSAVADGAATASISPGATRSNAAAVESASGVKVVRMGDAAAPGAMIIEVPPRLGVELAPAPDRRLVERGKYGPLPRIGPDGARPADVYARPLVTAAALPAGAPQIALVVGGMGLSETASRLALDKLPPEVTLAYAPFGADLEAQAARARTMGHEILLQAPMEQTGADARRALVPGLAPEETADRLAWLLSRFQGYVGIENFLGQRMTAQEDQLAPVLREVARRGLMYLDDGSSAVSVAPALGPALGAPTGRADVVLDADRNPAAMAGAFARLETLARQNGAAIGALSALPASVDQAAAFAGGLQKRGFALVPLTAIVMKAPTPSAKLSR